MTTEELYKRHLECRENLRAVRARFARKRIRDANMRDNPDYEDADILANDAFSQWLRAAIADTQ